MASRFRVRYEERIFGQVKIEGNRTFYSKDGFWWTGGWPSDWPGEISIYESDAFAMRFDVNHRPLFVRDLVEVTMKGLLRSKRLFEIIAFDEGFGIQRYPNGEILPLSYLDKYGRVEFKSFAFLQ